MYGKSKKYTILLIFNRLLLFSLSRIETKRIDLYHVPFLRLPKGEGNGNPLQYSWLENPMDGGAWWPAVHGVAKSRAWLSDFTFTFHFHALEKEMATHSSVLAWRIPRTEEPSGLPSMGSHRVGHNWSNLAAKSHKNNFLLFLWCQENWMTDTFADCVDQKVM